MKRYLPPLLAVLIAAGAGSSALQAQTPMGDPAEAFVVPFIGGGLARGAGDLSNDTDNGWMVLGGVDVPLPSVFPGLAIGVVGSFSQIPFGGGFDEAAQVTAVSAEAVYHIGDSASMLRPYIRGGGGVLIHRYDPGDLLTPAVTDTRAAVSAGAGLAIMMGVADALLGVRFGSGSDLGVYGVHAGVAVPVGASR